MRRLDQFNPIADAYRFFSMLMETHGKRRCTYASFLKLDSLPAIETRGWLRACTLRVDLILRNPMTASSSDRVIYFDRYEDEDSNGR